MELSRCKYGVGKLIYNKLYLHKTCVDKINDHKLMTEIQIKMKDGNCLPYNVIRYDLNNNEITFIIARDFDNANEPLPDLYVTIGKNGIKQTKGTQVWHHKWMFVDDEYMGFDVEQSKQRSRDWMSVMKIDYKLIGNPKYWEQKLIDYNLEPRI